MSLGESVQSLVRPPFANYDIVVYFGCGLYSLPLIVHYLVEPLSLELPDFNFDTGNSFADAAIATLSFLFAIYVLGHIIAYLSSLFIEKSTDQVFGKVSQAILLSDDLSGENYSDKEAKIRQAIWNSIKKSFAKGQVVGSVARTISIIPVLPAVIFIFFLGNLEYFDSRLSKTVVSRIKTRSTEYRLGAVSIDNSWFKTVEHYVINNHSEVVPRMYNYLVISGIFRSLSLLFLACVWAEVLYYLAHLISFDNPSSIELYSSEWRLRPVAMIIFINVVFVFTLASYQKFSRRYVEETLFAFALKNT